MPSLTNNFAFPVVADDARDPYVSWQHHRERGSQGGVDLAYPEGAEVASICDGWCEPLPDYGTGGNTMRVHADDGSYVEFMHLESFSRGFGDRISVHDVFGRSGKTGGDYAPHLHVHIYVNGVRCNVWDFFGSDSSSAAQPSSSATMSDVMWSGDDWSYAEPIGEVAARIQRGLSARGLYNREDGSARPDDGRWGEFTRKGVQQLNCDTGFFCGDIDGKIWRGGCYAVQDFAAAHGDYTARGGVRDGAPRSLSWECYAVGLERLNAPAAAPAAEAPAADVVAPVAEPAVETTAEPAEAQAPATETTSVSDAGSTHAAEIPSSSAPEPSEEQHSGNGASGGSPANEPGSSPVDVAYRPVNQRDVIAFQSAMPTVEVAADALGSILTDPKSRQRVYTVWVIIGLTLQGLMAGISAGLVAGVAAASAGWTTPLVVLVAIFGGAAGVYAALTPQVATLARANTPKR